MIRSATEQDLPAMVEIERDAQVHQWTAQQLAEELSRPSAHVLVAQSDGIVTGFVVGWSVADETHVLYVAVAPAHRRKGTGRALVKALLKKANNPVALLELHVGNANALRLYESLGFQGVGSRSNYYKDGEDALLMTLDSANTEEVLLGKG